MQTRHREIFFANFVSSVLAIFSLGCAFLLFLTDARLLVLQSFKLDSGEESEVEASSRNGEEWNLVVSYQKKKANIFKEMLYRVVRDVAFIWPPLVYIYIY